MANKSFLFHRIPLTPFKKQLAAGSVIGLLIFFILIVFQPFGTYGFSIPNKSLFLFGYGVINASSYICFYAAGFLLFPRWFSFSNWYLLKEATCLILVLLLMTMASLLYHHQFIGTYKLNLSAFLNFLKYSSAVAVVPFSILYYQKWIHFQLTQRVNENSGTENPIQIITFDSNNKNEPSITLPENEILFIKSEGNYIEIVKWDQQIIQRHLIRNTLNNVLAVLPDHKFCKIHRSFVVNLLFAERVVLNGSAYELNLSVMDQKLPVSRSMVKNLRQLIQNRR